MVKKCIVCGKEYNSKGNSICCSKGCSIKRKSETDKVKVANKQRTCNYCEKAFIGTSNTNYCSDECKGNAFKDKKKEYTHDCKNCGKNYVSKQVRRGYCSDECKNEWSMKHPRHVFHCEHCGKKFKTNAKSQKFCSSECAMEHRAIYPIVVCEHCGKEFRADGRQAGKFCSRECFLNQINARPWERKMQISDLTHIRRAKRLKIKYENINVNEVFERDNWTCKICGEPVDRYLPYPKPKSASLDHIIPLSKGGTHTLNNVQLAHLRCNLKKSDKIIQPGR